MFELDEEELKLYSFLFLPIIYLGESDNETKYNLLIGVKSRQIEIYDGQAIVDEMLLSDLIVEKSI